VPFFLRWPNGNLKQAGDIDTLTSHVDFMPTLMDLCGIDPQDYCHLQFHGRSLKPLMSEKKINWPQRTLVTDSQRLPNPVKWRKSAVMSQQWRLINGTELYDIQKDRGQINDVAASHPQIVDDLKTAYENWWQIVSRQFEEEIPISIGSDKEPETRLTSHDWRDPTNPHSQDPFVKENNDYMVYNQCQVRQGLGQNGYFEIQVQKSGTYRFELRRWPREEDIAMTDGIAETDEGWRSDVIHPRHRIMYSGGKAIAWTTAGIEIAGQALTQDIVPGSQCAVFTLDLPAGSTHLKTWLRTDDGMERGAYFVYVRLSHSSV
jgi:hypothetical protein